MTLFHTLHVLALGLWAGRRAGLRDATDFFLGGRRFAWWAVGTSMVATTVGPRTSTSAQMWSPP